MTDPTPVDLEAGLPEMLMRPVQISLSAGLMEGESALTSIRLVTVTADLRENGSPIETATRQHLMIGIDDAVTLIIEMTRAVNYHAELARAEAGK